MRRLQTEKRPQTICMVGDLAGKLPGRLHWNTKAPLRKQQTIIKQDSRLRDQDRRSRVPLWGQREEKVEKKTGVKFAAHSASNFTVQLDTIVPKYLILLRAKSNYHLTSVLYVCHCVTPAEDAPMQDVHVMSSGAEEVQFLWFANFISPKPIFKFAVHVRQTSRAL